MNVIQLLILKFILKKKQELAEMFNELIELIDCETCKIQTIDTKPFVFTLLSSLASSEVSSCSVFSCSVSDGFYKVNIRKQCSY